MRLLLDDKTGPAYNLNANEACVYACILKCTRAGKGWYGNYRDLASALPFVISYKTVSRAVENLINLGIVEKREDALFTVGQNVPNDGQIVPESGQNVQENGQIVLPPHPPIYNNNNEKIEKEQTRTPARDEEKGIFIMEVNFNNFWTAFHPSREMNSRKPVCCWFWEDVLDHSVRQSIVNELLALEADGQLTQERNPYFYLRSFGSQQPHNWNGDKSIDQHTAHRLFPAKYGSSFGSFTPEHIILFNLTVADDAKPVFDQYLRALNANTNKHPPKYDPH